MSSPVACMSAPVALLLLGVPHAQSLQYNGTPQGEPTIVDGGELLVKRSGLAGRATWKGHLAGFLFLCHDSERIYTYRIDPLHKRRPLCLMTSPRWRPKDPSSWKSSSPWVICDPVPSPLSPAEIGSAHV